jgi:hypothetical protein
VYLFGNYVPLIIGNKLPWIHQVLKAFFSNMREVMLDLRESASLVIKETMIFRNKARIRTREPQPSTEKLEVPYKVCRSLQKDAKKTTESSISIYIRGAQAVHSAQCAKMCAAQPARVHMMQRHGPACERDR